MLDFQGSLLEPTTHLLFGSGYRDPTDDRLKAKARFQPIEVFNFPKV